MNYIPLLVDVKQENTERQLIEDQKIEVLL